MFKAKNRFLVFFFVFSLLIGINSVCAQVEPVLNPSDLNDTEGVDEYYFTDDEFSEEYNFTNESISNIVITVPQDYHYVEAGTELLSSIKIMNLGSKRREDVVLDFEVLDSKGTVLLSKKETVAVETQANFVRIFQVPKDAKIGKYTIHVTLTHANGKTAVAEASFEIKDKKAELYNKIYWTVGAIVALGLIILLISKSGKWIDKYKLRRKIHRIVKNKLKR